MKKELDIALKNKQKVLLQLVDGDKVSGILENSTDPKRIKIHTSGSVIWIPLDEITHVNRLIKFH